MKKYRVNVNGTAYEIEVELMGETEATTPVASAPAAAPHAAAVRGGTIKGECRIPHNFR